MATVLIVEDDQFTRKSLCELLRDYDHRPVGVADGREALSLLESGFRPDVIVLERTMPVMDGAGFRAAQLRRPELAKIPVVVISAGEGGLPCDEDETAGWDILERPIPSRVLMSLIREFGARARPLVKTSR